jgi:hypothetical protein
MTQTAIRTDLLKTLDVLGALPSKVSLDLAGLDCLAEFHGLVLGQILDLGVGIYADLLQDRSGGRISDSVYIGEADHDALVQGKVYSCDPCHLFSLASACVGGSSR